MAVDDKNCPGACARRHRHLKLMSWGHVRVVHIALWMIACVATFAQQVWAGWCMVADVAIGAAAGFLYHGFEIEV